MIGIIGAMRIEVEMLIGKLEDAHMQTISGRDFYLGRLCGQDVVVVQGGVGKVNAAMCTEAMILTYHPNLIINTGVGGSITPGLRIGDIAIARDLVQYDVDTSAVGDPVGLVSTVNRIDFPCAPWAVEMLLETIEEQGLHGRAVRIASADRFNDDARDNRMIIEYFHGDVCEMEGCPIAQVCFINGIECAVIRAISDATEGEHGMEYAKFCALAAENSSKILLAFLEKLNSRHA